MNIYLDNAATTRIDPRVAEVMIPYLGEKFGNASSVHSFGRESRSAIEKARKKIADLINARPAEIVFTSGGTEADNMALISIIRSHKVRSVVTSKLEHHAVLHTLQMLEKSGEIELLLLDNDKSGNLDFNQLHLHLEKQPRSLVSLMQANNEIGNLYPVEEIAADVKERGGFFHSDTVQTAGKLHHDFSVWKSDFMIGSAHKFHGPKGVGFLAVSSDVQIPAYVTGGSQERNLRGGTENIMGIVGMAEALELSLSELDSSFKHITRLKELFKARIAADIPGAAFNGMSAEDNSLYTILNVSLPPSPHGEMLLANLDIRGIAVSGGSACSSGSDIGSHVLLAIGADSFRPSVRFSFSKFNTEEEIQKAADELSLLCKS